MCGGHDLRVTAEVCGEGVAAPAVFGLHGLKHRPRRRYQSFPDADAAGGSMGSPHRGGRHLRKVWRDRGIHVVVFPFCFFVEEA